MDSNNNQSDTEDANSEIRKYHFLVQENTWGKLVAFKGDLGTAIAAHKENTVNYLLELRNISSLAKLFLHHEDKNKIINII